MRRQITLCFFILCLLISVQHSANAQMGDELSIHKIAELFLPPLVSDVEWSPDGAYLAIVNYPSILIWATASQELKTLVPDAKISEVTWSPDSRFLAAVTGGEDDTLKIWELMTGQLIKLRTRVEPYSAVSFRASWSPDGKMIASDSSGMDMLIWSLYGEERIYTLQGHTGRIGAIDWSPDSDRIVSDSNDGTIRIWKISTKENLVTITQGYSPDWHPTEDKIAGLENGRIVIWDARTGHVLQRFDSDLSLLDVKWNFDGGMIATSGLNGVVKIWAVQSEELLRTIKEYNSLVVSLAWHPNRNLLASSDYKGNLTIWQCDYSEVEKNKSGIR